MLRCIIDHSDFSGGVKRNYARVDMLNDHLEEKHLFLLFRPGLFEDIHHLVEGFINFFERTAHSAVGDEAAREIGEPDGIQESGEFLIDGVDIVNHLAHLEDHHQTQNKRSQQETLGVKKPKPEQENKRNQNYADRNSYKKPPIDHISPIVGKGKIG